MQMQATLGKPTPRQREPFLLSLLEKLDRLDPDHIDQLYQGPCGDDVSFEESLIRSGLADERQVAKAYSDQYLFPLFDPPDDAPLPVDASVASLLPASYCFQNTIAPLSDDGQTVEIALLSPESLTLMDDIRARTGRQMRAFFAAKSVIQCILKDLYADGDTDMVDSLITDENQGKDNIGTRVDSDSVNDSASDADHVHESESPAAGRSNVDVESQANQYLSFLFEEAFRVDASTIHLEPLAKACRIRFRVEGQLVETKSPPLKLFSQLVREIKRLGQMDVNEDQLPQEGSIDVRRGGDQLDVRVCTCPTCFGEKVAIRMESDQGMPIPLTCLGFDKSQLKNLTDALGRKHGVVLVSGPSDSGQTNTLYACLRHLNTKDRSIFAIEDQIKMQWEGVSQVEARPEDGLSFATALKAVFRQDPDIVCVSKMNDIESAELCFRGGIKDHLILSATTGFDAASSIERMRSLGIDSSLLAEALNLLVSQRVLRRLCQSCKTPRSVGRRAAKRLKIKPESVLFRSRGCQRCDGSGYNGKIAVYEVLPIDARLRDQIRLGVAARDIRIDLHSRGIKLLGNQVRANIVSGQTSLEEALRLPCLSQLGTQRTPQLKPPVLG